MKIKSVEDLEVFKKAHNLTLRIYAITKSYPEEEKYGLISQMRRATFSIPSNLMEGSHRINRKEFRQFVGISKGSIGELKYYLLLSKDLDYISESEYFELKNYVEEISRMLTGLVNSLTHTDTDH